MINYKENPWNTTNSTQVYENPWISVREDKVITPAGKDGIYGVVTFKNKAIGVVPLDDEGNIYLVGQYRYPLDEYCWEIPEGGGPIGEEPLATAMRELKEETGLEAQKWTKISRIHTSNSVCNEEGFIFLAEKLRQGETEHEETEIIQLKKIPLRKAVEMVIAWEITDSLSIAGIMIAARLKNI
jgi:8-oxo-dGTP pyrophosphatase MutT (NUDIX family)